MRPFKFLRKILRPLKFYPKNSRPLKKHSGWIFPIENIRPLSTSSQVGSVSNFLSHILKIRIGNKYTFFYKKHKMGLRAKSFLNFWHFTGKKFLNSFLIFCLSWQYSYKVCRKVAYHLFHNRKVSYGQGV